MSRLRFFLPFLLLLLSMQPLQAQSEEGDHLKEDILRNEAMLHAIPLEEALGPVGGIAVSPFFGITLTSAASLAANEGMFPNNDFFRTNKLLGSWWAFGFFLLLTLLTSFPNAFKGIKWLGLIIGWIEDHSTLIVLGSIIVVTVSSSTSPVEQPMVDAGFVHVSYGILLMILAGINFFVVKTVRYFFEILIFLSPVPFLDTIFEIGKKGTAFGLFALYAFNPWAAFGLNMVLFLIALLFFNKARRTVKYFRYVYIKPRIGKWMGIKRELIHKRAPQNLKELHPNLTAALPTFALTKLGTIKRKQLSWLVIDGEDLWLYRFRWFRQPFKEQVNKPAYGPLRIGDDYMYIKLYSEDKRNSVSLVVNNEYMPHYAALTEMGRFSDAGEIGVKKAMRAAKEKTKSFFQRLFGRGEVQLSREDVL